MEGPLRQVERIEDWKKLYLDASAESGRDQGGVGDGGGLDDMGLVSNESRSTGKWIAETAGTAVAAV